MIRACFTRKIFITSFSPVPLPPIFPPSSYLILPPHTFFLLLILFFFSHTWQHILCKEYIYIITNSCWLLAHTHTEKRAQSVPFKRKLSCDEKKPHRRVSSKHTSFLQKKLHKNMNHSHTKKKKTHCLKLAKKWQFSHLAHKHDSFTYKRLLKMAKKWRFREGILHFKTQFTHTIPSISHHDKLLKVEMPKETQLLMSLLRCY